MKLKPVISPLLPVRVTREFIDPSLETWYIVEVVEGCLHTPREETFPDSHYIQWPDFMVQRADGSLGIETTFSKLSAWPFKRSGSDFYRARLLIRDKFANILGDNLAKSRQCGLYVSSQTDEPTQDHDGTRSTLLDVPRIVVTGMAEPNEELDVPTWAFSLKPLQPALWFNTKPLSPGSHSDHA